MPELSQRGYLKTPVRIFGHSAVQYVNHRLGRLGGCQKMRRPGQCRPQQHSTRRAYEGKVSSRRSRSESNNARPYPPQITGNILSFLKAAAIKQMLDEVIAHIPVSETKLPPCGSHRTISLINWSLNRQLGCDSIQQSLVQRGEPLRPQFAAQEVAHY